jgi:putative membrane protein
MMWGYGLSWPGMFIMMALGSLLWIALIAVIVWASMSFLNKKGGSTMQSVAPSAMEILRQRYARGEIDSTTFEQMRAQLQESEQERFAQSREPLRTTR